MYLVTSSVYVHFAHHVRGHAGPCISLHGHTWKLEVILQARELDAAGFVVDFDVIKERLLDPCHALLDHSLAVGPETWGESKTELERLGHTLVASREAFPGTVGQPPPVLSGELGGARNERPGGIKVAVFPFSPTSEQLACWLHGVSNDLIGDDRVSAACGRIYEALHPTELIAEYRP